MEVPRMLAFARRYVRHRYTVRTVYGVAHSLSEGRSEGGCRASVQEIPLHLLFEREPPSNLTTFVCCSNQATLGSPCSTDETYGEPDRGFYIAFRTSCSVNLEA